MDEVVLRPAGLADVPAVQQLAARVWRAHYPGIISLAQIDYMLERGYATEALRTFIGSDDAGLELAREGEALIGFAAWMNGPRAGEVKLDKLYVDPDRQRGGIGGRLIERVCDLARGQGAQTLVLNVNRHNTGAQAAYRKRGFDVRETVVIDIGGGFVMDDYVMARAL